MAFELGCRLPNTRATWTAGDNGLILLGWEILYAIELLAAAGYNTVDLNPTVGKYEMFDQILEWWKVS